MGTVAYLPPESLHMLPMLNTIQRDMWALGVTLYEVLNGEHPIFGPADIATIHAIPSWEPKVLPDIISHDMKMLISSL